MVGIHGERIDCDCQNQSAFRPTFTAKTLDADMFFLKSSSKIESYRTMANGNNTPPTADCNPPRALRGHMPVRSTRATEPSTPAHRGLDDVTVGDQPKRPISPERQRERSQSPPADRPDHLYNPDVFNNQRCREAAEFLARYYAQRPQPITVRDPSGDFHGTLSYVIVVDFR
jgi:hypothetical protein